MVFASRRERASVFEVSSADMRLLRVWISELEFVDDDLIFWSSDSNDARVVPARRN